VPYVVGELKDFNSLIKAHNTYQTRMLTAGSTDAVPHAILVTAGENVGIGNRLPSIVTAFVMALFTSRLLLVEAGVVLHHINLPFPADWHQYRHMYSHHPCPGFFLHDGLQPCVHQSNWSSTSNNATTNNTGLSIGNVVLVRYRSADYDMPLLQINPYMYQLFNTYIPDGEVFHAVAKYLFNPTATLSAAMQPYLQQARWHRRHLQEPTGKPQLYRADDGWQSLYFRIKPAEGVHILLQRCAAF
jgi:hypothetical protein